MPANIPAANIIFSAGQSIMIYFSTGGSGGGGGGILN
jgi:hypothetical protein